MVGPPKFCWDKDFEQNVNKYIYKIFYANNPASKILSKVSKIMLEQRSFDHFSNVIFLTLNRSWSLENTY